MLAVEQDIETPTLTFAKVGRIWEHLIRRGGGGGGSVYTNK